MTRQEELNHPDWDESDWDEHHEILRELDADDAGVNNDSDGDELDQESIAAFDEALAREERHEEQKAERERKVQP